MARKAIDFKFCATGGGDLADIKSARQERQGAGSEENSFTGAEGMPSEARCLHKGVHDDAQEAELGFEKSCPSQAYEQH